MLTSTPRRSFPWHVPVGALLLAALYLPTLRTPFDFIDDGDWIPALSLLCDRECGQPPRSGTPAR